MGSFLSRAFLLVFGYAYPAYKCFKVVENKKAEIEQLLFWCKYWILVAMLTICERVGDAFISWLPMYNEAKLAFFIYLWYPKSKGTVYIYNSFFQPIVAKHETEIDRNLLELKIKASEIAVIYWQKALSCGQTRFFEILQYFSSQSASQPHPDQQQQNAGYSETLASALSCQASATKQEQSQQCLPDSSSILLSQQQHEPAQEASLPIATCSDKRMPIEPVLSLENGNSNPSQQEKVSEDAIPVSRGKWRLFSTTANR